MGLQETKIDKEQFGPWAIVTGASSGIGKEFARQLASAGLNLVLVARRRALLEELSQNLTREFTIQCKVLGPRFNQRRVYFRYRRRS